MKKLIFFLSLAVSLVSCSKKESGNFFFEVDGSDGIVNDMLIVNDTSYVLTGQLDGSDYLLSISNKGSEYMSYSTGSSGAYTSLLYDGTDYMAAGYNDAGLLVSKVSPAGSLLWSLAVESAFEIRNCVIRQTSSGDYLAIGSDDPDSLRTKSLLLVYFDDEGNTIDEIGVTRDYYIAVNDFIIDDQDYILTATTKAYSGGESKASISLLSPEGNIVWDQELYNNNDFQAATLDLKEGDNNRIYATGKVELITGGGEQQLDNSFLVCLDISTGDIFWKRYLENSNIGVDIAFDDNSNVLLLNRNCYLIDLVLLPDADEDDLFRMFEVCDSYNTDTRAGALELTDDGDYLIGGSRAGKIYYALRKSNADAGDEN